MARKLIDLGFSPEQLQAIDGALAVLEANLGGLIALTAGQRHTILKMGAGSEPFCRRTLLVLTQNPRIVPPGVDVGQANADLETLDQLRPRSDRLQQLLQRVQDSEMALGSDALGVAHAGYKLIKVVGPQEGPSDALRDLESRFKGSRRGNRGQPDADGDA